MIVSGCNNDQEDIGKASLLQIISTGIKANGLDRSSIKKVWEAGNNNV